MALFIVIQENESRINLYTALILETTMEDNKLKTSSYGLIIKTFAIFAIILSSNAANYTPIYDSSHTTSSTSYSTKHSDDDTTTHKHIQQGNIVTHTHEPISADKTPQTTPHEHIQQGNVVTHTHEPISADKTPQTTPHEHIHKGQVITHTHEPIKKRNTKKTKSIRKNKKHSKDTHLKQKKKIQTDAQNNYKMITESQLQGMVDTLSKKDKTVINQMQSRIAGWPDEIFQEVRSYNEFIVLVTKQAKERYKKLSSAAREALEAEKDLKKNLSPEALELLSTLHVENAY